ncbi:TPA: hypothetical protein ACH3X2_002689 [Trebouxia sp. C0005]
MAFRPLSVIAAVRQPGDIEDVAEERAQVANANYIAARRWDALVESRNVCEQVSTARAELQSEVQRSTRRLRVVEKELEALDKEHKDFVRAYASVEGSSCNIEAYLRQEIEAADMLRSNMQQVYKEQLHEQQGLVAELVKENQSLMEDKAALTKEVSWLRHQLDIAQTTQATPTGPRYVARSSLELGTGGSPLTPFVVSPTSGVASLSDAGSPMSSSSVASHSSEAFNCLMEDLAIGTGELSRGASIVQTMQATPAGPANMASPPFGSSPSFQQRALLTTPHPIPVYQSGQVAVDRVPEPEAGGWHVRVHESNPRRVTFRRRAACSNNRVFDPEAGTPDVQLHASNPRKVTLTSLLAASCAHKQDLRSSPCPDNPLKVIIRGVPITKQHPSSPMEVDSSPAELDAAASTSSSPSPSASPVNSLHSAFLSESPSARANMEALSAMDTFLQSPKGTPLVNRSQRLTLAKELTRQARSLSISGTPSTPSAESPTFGTASLSAPDSPIRISSSVASHDSDVVDCPMEDRACLTKALSKGANIVQTPRATPAGPANMASSPFGSKRGMTPSTSSSNSPTCALRYLFDAESCNASSLPPSRSSDVAVSPLLISPSSQKRAMVTRPTPLTQAAVSVVSEPKAGGWHVRVHDSNPLRVTFRRRAKPSGPVPSFALPSPSPPPYSSIPLTATPLLVPSALNADMVRGSSISLSLSGPSSASGAGRLLAASCAPAPCLDKPVEVTVRGSPVANQHPSSPLEVEASAAELDADAAANTSSSPSCWASPVTSELLSPRAIVKALTAMGTPSESPKATLLARRPALANLTNGLTPQVQARVTPGLAASAKTSGKANLPTSAAGRHLSALLKYKSSLGSPSPCPRPKTSPERVVVSGSKSASGTRSSRGSEASPGTPPALDLLTPARALGNRPRAVGRFSMALPSDAAAVSRTDTIQALVSSPTAPTPPRAIGSHLMGSAIGPKAFGYTPTVPVAEPPVSVHSLGLPVPEAQGPASSPAVQPAVNMSSAALMPLQLTPVQQPLQALGPSARSVAASNGRTRTVPSSALSSGKASRRSSICNSIADRPAWSASFSRCTAVHTRLAEDMTPVSRRLTTASPHRAASSPPPSPSPVRAVVDSPAVESSSVQAIRRTGSKAVAARLMSTAKTGGSTTAAQPGGVRPTAAQPNAGRATAQGTSRAARAGTIRPGPAAPAPAAQRPATRSSKAAASTPAEQSVAVHKQAASGKSGVVQRESGPAPVELRQANRGKAKTVNKEVAPIRTQPARRAKNPGHTWKF